MIPFDYTIKGIPCKIHVKKFVRHPGTFSPTAPDPCTYFGWLDVDYEVLDRKGHRAGWLERKLDSKSEAELIDEIADRHDAEMWDEH